MSRWTAYLIAAATVAGSLSIAVTSASAAAAAARGGAVAAPMGSGVRPAPRMVAPRMMNRAPQAHVVMPRRGPYGGHVAGAPPSYGRHGFHDRGQGRRHARWAAGGVWGGGYVGGYAASAYAEPAYNTGYAEPPLHWTHAEPDLAPCSRPLIIQIGASAYNRLLPVVRHGDVYPGGGCGAPQVVRYVGARPALQPTAEARTTGSVVRVRN